MRCHHDGTTARERVANARHRRADARVVGDRSRIFLRYVQVGADEHALATHVDVRESFEIHGVPARRMPIMWTSSYSPSSFLPRTRVPSITKPTLRYSAMA